MMPSSIMLLQWCHSLEHPSKSVIEDSKGVIYNLNILNTYSTGHKTSVAVL
jgi:hypothetical protein